MKNIILKNKEYEKIENNCFTKKQFTIAAIIVFFAAVCAAFFAGLPSSKNASSIYTDDPLPWSNEIAVSHDEGAYLVSILDRRHEASEIENTVLPADYSSAEAISEICGIRSLAETNVRACSVNVFDSRNPYDVVYNYGNVYNKYVGICDWTLVFDADYYMKEFPLLAMQYHYDENLLLEHFQTVGIHEGRQGCENFNAGAYKENCDPKIRNAFGDNYEGYFFYYMLNQPAEKSVDTVNGRSLSTQYKTILTALQAEELVGVNYYRSEVNVQDITFNGELAAFANYRAYINAHDQYKEHDWAKEHNDILYNVIDLFGAAGYSENTCEKHYCDIFGYSCADGYRTSQLHYEGMINAAQKLIGCSNSYYDDDFTCQFDTFIASDRSD